MDEPFKTSYVRRSVKDFGPFRDCCEGTEEKWFNTICPRFGKSNSLSRRRRPEVHIGSSRGMVNQFIMAKGDDGGGNVDVESPSVRGPPSLGLRARTKDVAQILMALRGSSHAYNFDCRLCFGRLIGDHDDRFEGFCWSKTLWRHRKG